MKMAGKLLSSSFKDELYLRVGIGNTQLVEDRHQLGSRD